MINTFETSASKNRTRKNILFVCNYIVTPHFLPGFFLRGYICHLTICFPVGNKYNLIEENKWTFSREHDQKMGRRIIEAEEGAWGDLTGSHKKKKGLLERPNSIEYDLRMALYMERDNFDVDCRLLNMCSVQFEVCSSRWRPKSVSRLK